MGKISDKNNIIGVFFPCQPESVFLKTRRVNPKEDETADRNTACVEAKKSLNVLIDRWNLQMGKTDNILGDGSKLVGANLLFSLATFGVATLAARTLGPAEFGTWGALWAMIIVTAALFPSVVMVTAREVSDLLARGRDVDARDVLHRFGFWTLVSGIVLTVLLVALAGPVARWLAIEHAGLIHLVAFFFFASLLLAFVRGGLEGILSFNALAANISLEGGLRLLIGVAALFAGMGIAGLMSAYVFAAAFAVVIATIHLHQSRLGFLHFCSEKHRGFALESRTIRFLLPVLVTHGAIVVLTNVDMFVVKHAFSKYQAGLFSACFTGGKLLFFLSEGLSTVMFPKVVIALSRKENPRPLLKKTVLVYCAGAAAALLVSFLFPEKILILVFGNAFASAAPLVFPYILFASSVSLAVLLTKYRLAEGRFGFLAFFVAWTVLLAGLILLYHPSLQVVVWLLAAGGAVLAFAIALPLAQEGREEVNKK